MRTAYKVLAYLVAAEVAVQAMFAVWAVAGLSNWVDGGGVFDKAVIEGAAEGGAMPFSEILGIILHGINGTVVIPVIALALLIVSFFAKVNGAIKWAVIVFVLVVAQGTLGLLGREFSLMGALHGLNALALFGVALHTCRRVPSRRPVAAEQARVATPV